MITSKTKLIKTILISSVLTLLLSGCFGSGRPGSDYIMPDGYTGWVYIIFDQAGYNNIQKIDGRFKFKIDSTGILKTSTKEPTYGVAQDRYYYLNETEKEKELDRLQMIHGEQIMDKETNVKSYPKVIAFFIGTESQFKKAQPIQYPL